MEKNYNEVSFICPKCEESFTLEELVKHNNQALNEYLNIRASEELSKKEADLLAKAKEESAKEFEAKRKEIELEYTNKINDLVSKNKDDESKLELEKQKAEANLNEQILQLTNKYENLNESINKQLELQKEKLANEYSNTLNEKDNSIKELNQKIESIKKELQISKEIELQSKELELTKNFNKDLSLKDEQISSFKETISELNMTIKELQTQLKSEKDKFDSEKVTAIQAKELELNNKHQEEIISLNNQINELKIENNSNRIINNKIKGENFEHEVEGELTKTFTFSLPDSIEKANEVKSGRKPDYIQTVKTPDKKIAGKIIYEVKNADWSNTWLPKLAEECADNKTKYGILITNKFRDKFHEVPFVQSDEYENIFITDPFNFIFVAQVIRKLVLVDYEMSEKEKTYNSQNKDKNFKEYENKVNAIKEFMISDLPKYQKSFSAQLQKLDKVKKSLSTNAGTIEKVIDDLKSKTQTSIFDKLSKITGNVLVPLDDEE